MSRSAVAHRRLVQSAQQTYSAQSSTARLGVDSVIAPRQKMMEMAMGRGYAPAVPGEKAICFFGMGR